MARFDRIAVSLRCPRTGSMAPADSTNLQTQLRDLPTGQRFEVGDRLRAPDAAEATELGYWIARVPTPGTPVRVLETWDCGACAAGIHWAEVVIEGDVIQSVEDVPLNRGTLGRMHYLSAESVASAGAELGVQVGTRPALEVLADLLAKAR